MQLFYFFVYFFSYIRVSNLDFAIIYEDKFKSTTYINQRLKKPILKGNESRHPTKK